MFRARATARADTTLFYLALLAAVSMPLAVDAAQSLPAQAYFAPALAWKNAAVWAAYWTLLALPFFFASAATGLALMTAGDTLATVYGVSLA